MKYLLLIYVITTTSFAIELSSSDQKVKVIELFSSEGCSSCPRAEKWLNQLKGSDSLWKRFVPVEQHVTYWDDLVWFGSKWKDPFSKKEFTQRQRQYHSIRGKGVYTPQLIVDGQVSKNYSLKSSPQKVGVLKLNFKDNIASVSFNSVGSYKSLVCEGSLLFGGVVSKVKGGENKGESLDHEFLSSGVVKQQANTLKNSHTCKLVLDKSFKNIKFKRKAIAVWIKDKNENIIQAVGGYIN